MNRALSSLLFLSILAVGAITGWFWQSGQFSDGQRLTSPRDPATFASNKRSSEEMIVHSEEPSEVKVQYPLRVGRDKRFWNVMVDLGFSPTDIHGIVRSAKPHLDLARISSKTPFRVEITGAKNPVPSGIEFKISAASRLKVIREKKKWRAEKIELPTQVHVENFQGRVSSSLWNSAIEAKMNPQLIVQLTEIFAWQIDFARELRAGDLWRISVEKKFVAGDFAGWGAILAAEYINSGKTYQAYRFVNDNEFIGYFDGDGNSLEKLFLKSPIKFGRISSRFSRRRFHPVKKVYRAHRGVDYAAPTGTPIRAVGDGKIIKIGRYGGAGKMIKIRHNEFYQTRYLHMSRFARGMKKNRSVKQGQIIGYVGKTGLASGPHLHYEFFKKGRYVDPLNVKFPSAKPVPKDLLAEFSAQKSQAFATLPFYERKIAQEESRLQFK